MKLKIKNRLFIACLMLMLSLQVLYAKTITLDDAIELAFKNNQTIQTARLELEQTANTLNVKTWLPTMSAKATVSENVNLIGKDKGFQKPSISISPSVTWKFGTSNLTEVNANKLSLISAQLKYQTKVIDAQKSVMSSYVNLISLLNGIKQAETALSTAQTTYQNSVEKYEDSQISELTLLQAKISYQDLRLSLDNAKTKYATAEESFRILVGLPKNSVIELEQMPDVVNLDISKLEKIAEERINETISVKSAQIAYEIAKNNESKKKISERAPSATLNTSFSYNGSYSEKTSNQFQNSMAVSGTLTVDIPLDSYLPWTQANANVKNTELSTEIAKISYENTLRTAKNSIDSTVNAIEQAYSKVKNLEDRYNMTEENLRLVTLAYESGYTSFSELNSARTSWLNAQNSLLENTINIMTQLCQFASNLEMNLNSLLEYLK